MPDQRSMRDHLVIKAISCGTLAILGWIAILVSAPMINRTNSVSIWGDDASTRAAIRASRATIVARRGNLLLVQRQSRDLAKDLVNHGAVIVLPDVVFYAF
jgi:hypothetical protein